MEIPRLFHDFSRGDEIKQRKATEPNMENPGGQDFALGSLRAAILAADRR